MSEEIKEEIPVEEGEKKEGRTWTEDVQVAGENVIEFIQSLFHEANVRRITVKSKNGRVLLDIPVVLGAVAFFPPLLMYSAIAVGAAVLSNCTITIERAE